MNADIIATKAVDEINKLLPSPFTPVGRMEVYRIILGAIGKSLSPSNARAGAGVSIPTLREWYAGMALAGLLSGMKYADTAVGVALAEHCFKMADEMMKSAEVRRKS